MPQVKAGGVQPNRSRSGVGWVCWEPEDVDVREEKSARTKIRSEATPEAVLLLIEPAVLRRSEEEDGRLNRSTQCLLEAFTFQQTQ